MPKSSLTPQLVESLSSALQRYSVSRNRAQVLAQELVFLNEAVFSAARHIAFEGEPSQFEAILRGERRR